MVDRFEIGRGLDVPISGEPEQKIESKEVRQVAIVADDYIGMRPTLLVSEGDEVVLGQPVFSDKKTPGVVFTAPAGGRVAAVNRGAKRRFLSIVIDKQGDQQSRKFASYDAVQLQKLSRDVVVSQLVDSGLWTALRTRPFSKVPSPESQAQAIFVNAMDTNPLAAAPAAIVAERQEAFTAGLSVLSSLTDGPVFVCRAPSSAVPGDGTPRVKVAEFDGPHPAGLVGTHMHFLKPATIGRVNWHLNYQDAIAIGQLFLTGELDLTRIVSLAGPGVKRPRLIQTQLGASIEQLVEGELNAGDNRIVSGSVLNGRSLENLTGYLGRYHLQVSCLLEGTEREFLGWQSPGFDKFSVTRAFAAAWQGSKKFAMTTSTGGSERAMVPIGSYEKVMPLDLLPTLLLRALISRETAVAQDLGCLELDEEDLGLCTFVCPGKYEYGEILRDNLLTIEREG
ncbi:Na(+)-translocating NADH-quinone reductase subunit A [Aureliella helgolandensis]|uniref:Na(+)-translocating NADH-quinone reductase subunit A n=1 Tax=Aureliella helgolandensis TaxID=2527968 RepID=A0A518GGB6_9BACT|nr:Na(+)-translocating NADH-quinone reductase subunit A [Aureliella helgolandensis]QDV27639.1 Na(+)-translocating NADH-quinone reductase subunit A [Aureliella helgolandensis]